MENTSRIYEALMAVLRQCRRWVVGLINAHTDLSQAKPRSGKAAAARWPSGIYR